MNVTIAAYQDAASGLTYREEMREHPDGRQVVRVVTGNCARRYHRPADVDQRRLVPEDYVLALAHHAEHGHQPFADPTGRFTFERRGEDRGYGHLPGRSSCRLLFDGEVVANRYRLWDRWQVAGGLSPRVRDAAEAIVGRLLAAPAHAAV
jgi:hypothetical protein